MVDNNQQSIQINQLLTNSLKDEMPIGERQVYKIAQQFREESRIQVQRIEGSGSKKTQRTEENVEKIREAIEEDPHLSLQALCEITEMSRSTIQRILKEDLNKKSLNAKWIPHSLTNHQKQQRIEQIEVIQRSITKNVLFIDQKWVYLTPLPPLQNVRSWVDENGERPQQERRNLTNKKFMIIVAIKFNSDYYFEVLEDKESINSQHYNEFLKNLFDNVDLRRYVIMHDNARPHKSILTANFLKENKIKIINQPAYSPDVNLFDRFIFRNFETARAKITFNNNDEIVTFLEQFLDSLEFSLLKQEYNNYLNDLQQIVDLHGNYLS